jgi:hypothetical protein
MHHDLGYIDLEHRTLQTRLLPISPGRTWRRWRAENDETENYVYTIALQNDI